MNAGAQDSTDERTSFTSKYDVERVLGRGGMGTIFEARHARLGSRVAIKVLGEELRRHPELVKRFEREARLAGALTSPHAVRIFDVDQTEDGTPFIVMELLSGRDLGQLLEEQGPQPIGAAVRWVIEACAAIGEAHRLGIVHRDIKPSNLFVCEGSGAIKVLDFGIAKQTAPGEATITLVAAPLGTPQYMSPEQVRCATDVDARSDIWSLGVTLYELLCGRPPFHHEVPQACIAAVVADPVPDPRELRDDLPEELVEVLLRALAKDPADRYASVDELARALAPFAGEALDATPALAAPAVSWPRVPVAASSLDDLAGERDAAPDRGRDRDRELAPPAPAPRRRRPKRSRSLAPAMAGLAVLGISAVVAGPHAVRVAPTTPVSEVVATSVELPLRARVLPLVEDAGATGASIDGAPAHGGAPAVASSAPRARPAASPWSKPRPKPAGRPSTSSVLVRTMPAAHGGISDPGL